MRRRPFLGHMTALGSLAACGTSAEEPVRPRRPHREESVTSFRLVTYNVLADPVHIDARLPPLFEALTAARADVIALQEVAPWFLEALHRQEWTRHFHFASIDGRGADQGGQAILSRMPVQNVRSVLLPGRQRRTVLLADVVVPGTQPFVVATTHMESFLEDGALRAAQLDVIFTELERRSLLSGRILCGDLNFGEGEEPDTSHLDENYVDAWNELRPNLPGYTWDVEASEMARAGSFVGESSRRLDRVLLRSATWAARSIEIIGDTPIDSRRTLFPSDHFGLVAGFQRTSLPT